MRTTLPLLVAAIALPIGVNAAPSLKITYPKPNADLTVGVTNVSGTAKSTSAITGVYYSLNGNSFTKASGTTNWSATNLTLNPGLNSFSAYAVDSAIETSPTNKITFTYVYFMPVAVTVSPSNSWGGVSITNGEMLQFDKQYNLAAKAARGFGFAGWAFDGTNVPGERASTKVVMTSNLTVVASFIDITKPLCAVTFPAAGHTVTNSVVANIRAKDSLVGVESVYYQFNSNGWVLASPMGDGTNWQTASLTVSAGGNMLQAYAVNAVGTNSAINTVRFNGVNVTPPVTGPAPESLAGLAGMVTNDDGSIVQISFGASTYALGPIDTNSNPKVGDYTYTLLSSNTARLTTLVDSPPNKADQASIMIWTFTSTNFCTTTNITTSNTAAITFSPVADLVPSPSASITSTFLDDSGNSGTNVSIEGVFTNYSSNGTNWGTYCVFQFSPIVALKVMVYTDPVLAGYTDYVELTYAAQGAGTYYNERFDGSNDLADAFLGSFTGLTNVMPSGGNSPTTIAGKIVTVTKSDGSPFDVTFDDSTYSVFDPKTNDQNTAVGDYTFTKTGPNTAQLTMITVAPWQDTITNDNTVTLTFTKTSSGTAASGQGGGVSTFSIKGTANDYAPASLVGKTVNPGSGKSGTFNDDGTFTFTKPGQQPETDPYSYTRYSADGGLFVITHSDGSSTDVQLKFTSTGSGDWYETDFDSNGNIDGIDTGSFTLK